MKIAVLTINYLFSLFIIITWIITAWSFYDWLNIFLLAFILNIIYIHMNKPVDTEKEELKKKISELEKKETL